MEKKKTKILMTACFVLLQLLGVQMLKAQVTANEKRIMMQGFYWDCFNESGNGNWWNFLQPKVASLSTAGVTEMWLPVSNKALNNPSMGYDGYDYYDLGEFNQTVGVETFFGSRAELQNLISAMHNTGMKAYADMVFNHVAGGTLENNPNTGGQTPTSFTPASGKYTFDYNDFHPSTFESSDEGTFGSYPDLCHANPHVMTVLKDLEGWLINTIGYDGFRYDWTNGYHPSVIRDLQNSHGKFGVTEFWMQDKNTALQYMADIQYKSNVFDFPLFYHLKDMCNQTSGGYDMRNLWNAGLVTSQPANTVTFLQNHDTDKEAQHQIVNEQKMLGYAYILTQQGLPCVFYRDYFNYGLAKSGTPNGIDQLMWVRKNLATGAATQLYADEDLFVMQRGGTPGLLLVMNDNSSVVKTTTVKTKWANTTLKPYAWYSTVGTATPPCITTDANGNVNVSAGLRGYVVYAPNDGTSSPVTCGSTVPVTGAILNPTNATLTAGSTQQLTPIISPSNASDKSVTWTSNNTSVATVNASGLVTAVAAGAATITVRSVSNTSVTAASSITVNGNVPSTIYVRGTLNNWAAAAMTSSDGGTNWRLTGVSISAGAQQFKFANTNDWSGVDWGNANGLSGTTQVTTGGGANITFTAPNTATYTLTFNSTNLQYTVASNTSNIAVTGISVSPTSASINIGATQQLTATIAPANASNKSVTWTSSNTSAAIVTANGLVTAVASGTATITVRSVSTNSIIATSSISVNSGTPSTIYVGGTFNNWALTAMTSSDGGTNWRLTGVSMNAGAQQLKYANTNNWSGVDWGNANGFSGTAQVTTGGGANIVFTVPSTGTYTLNFNSTSLQYSIVGGASTGLPSPWVRADIGTVTPAGNASYSNASFTSSAAGADIWGTADAFGYVYYPVSGNITITARVASLANTNAWAKAGVMIRGSLSANSQFSMMAVTPSNGSAMQSRLTNGASAISTTGPSVSAPYWVRLQRNGNSLVASVSSDGANWLTVDTQTITMPSTAYIGLAVTSHNNGTLTSATFTNVSVKSATGTTNYRIGVVDSNDEELPSSSSLSEIYPNPAQQSIVINLKEFANEEVNIKLVNTQGMSFVNETVVGGKNHTVDVSQLTNGLYVVSLHTNKSTKHLKLIIAH